VSSKRRSVTSGSEWETRYGYHRAVAVGEQAWVSGTTAASRGGVPDPDPVAQTRTAFTIGLEALAELGFDRTEVVRTRMFVTDAATADVVGAVHGEFFGAVKPTATLVCVSGLIDPRLKIEIEIEAVKDGTDT
jgi:enamine deaminase RidA (YjgF/YER057c/UK114 family)